MKIPLKRVLQHPCNTATPLQHSKDGLCLEPGQFFLVCVLILVDCFNCVNESVPRSVPFWGTVYPF